MLTDVLNVFLAQQVLKVCDWHNTQNTHYHANTQNTHYHDNTQNTHYHANALIIKVTTHAPHIASGNQPLSWLVADSKEMLRVQVHARATVFAFTIVHTRATVFAA